MGCIGPSIVVLQFGSLYKFVKIQGFHHCIILHVPGRDFQSQFQMDKPSANVLHQHTNTPGVDPRPTWENYIFLSHLEIKGIK